MTSPSLSLRIEKEVLAVWKETAEKLGYKDLTEFILCTMNQAVLNNTDLVSEINQEIVREKDRDMKKKKIRYLQKANRSEAFEPARYIRNILRSYDHEKDFVNERYLLADIKHYIEIAKLSKDPPALLLNILPELRNKKMRNAENLVKSELITMGVPQSKIESHLKTNMDSIRFRGFIQQKPKENE